MEEEADLGVGTTNIVSIFGGKIYIAADGRVTKDDGLIENEAYIKIVKLRSEVEIYATVCGGIRVHERMQTFLREKMGEHKNPSVSLVAEWATLYLRAKSKKYYKEKVGKKPDSGDIDACTAYEERILMWTNHYHNSTSFICGFEKEVPRVFLVNDRYEKGLDITKEYTSSQIKMGMTKEEISLAKNGPSPHHKVRGSYNKGVTEFIENSLIFKRIKDIFQFENNNDLDDMERRNRDVNFKKLSSEYAKAMVCATTNDHYTGGNFIVKQLSRDGSCLEFHFTAIHEYLKHFKHVEKDQVLFMLLQRSMYTTETIATLLKYFEKLNNDKVEMNAIGFLGEFVLYRVRFFSDGDVELAYEKVLGESFGKGQFGMSETMLNDIFVLVCRPTVAILNRLLKCC